MKKLFSEAPLAMGITGILIVALILGGERILFRGQDTSISESGSDCCPSISVSLGGSYANLAGDYQLKEDAGSKPEEVCVNGCIYTKVGSPSTDEYCFKSENVSGQNIQCKVRKTSVYSIVFSLEFACEI